MVEAARKKFNLTATMKRNAHERKEPNSSNFQVYFIIKNDIDQNYPQEINFKSESLRSHPQIII